MPTLPTAWERAGSRAATFTLVHVTRSSRFPSLTRANTHSGEYRNDLAHGKGKYTYANGEHYEGEFVKGNKHGSGTYSWPNGEVQSGRWKNDKML